MNPSTLLTRRVMELRTVQRRAIRQLLVERIEVATAVAQKFEWFEMILLTESVYPALTWPDFQELVSDECSHGFGQALAFKLDHLERGPFELKHHALQAVIAARIDVADPNPIRLLQKLRGLTASESGALQIILEALRFARTMPLRADNWWYPDIVLRVLDDPRLERVGDEHHETE